MTRSWLLVGGGNVGARVAALLALRGDGALTVVDFDRIELHNLAVQPFPADALGRSKAEVIAGELGRLRPDVPVVALTADVRTMSLSALAAFDVVIAAVDSLAVEAWIADACRLAGTPMIRGATSSGRDGHSSATVRLFPADDGATCPRCSWGPTTWALADRRAPCTEGLDDRNPFAGAVQTAADGAMAASLVVRALDDLGDGARMAQVLGAGVTLGAVAAPLRRNPACPGEHHVAAVAPLDVDAGLRGLVDAAGAALGAGPDDVFFDLGLRPVLQLPGCECGRDPTIELSTGNGGPLLCDRCGERQAFAMERTLLSSTQLTALVDHVDVPSLAACTVARGRSGAVARFLPNGGCT